MKKIFTLVSVALVAISASAQTPITYNAVTFDGTTVKLGSAFAAVAGEDGGVANNAADGKSVVTAYNGNGIVVTAVGGTTPANVVSGSGQQITPGAAIEGQENVYEIAEVAAWNNVEWKKTSVGGKGHSMNNGDKDSIYTLDGTGNPYIAIYAEEILDQGSPTGDYRAKYTYYNPDGSLGLPMTGLYYSFKSEIAGAFKVKVWANNGNRPTYVVNATAGEQFAKAQPLLVEGYINGQDWKQEDADAGTVDASLVGKRKYLLGAQIKAIHDEATNPWADETRYTDAERAQWDYVIGRGNQPFWGYLLFDVNAGEEYWVFQPSSQIGFGGFIFTPGANKEDLAGIKDVVKEQTVVNGNAALYNLAGQKVDKDYKGIVIQKGKKYLMRK